MAEIDHLILNVNDVSSSVDFYVNVLGFELEGKDGPFTVIRVSEEFTLQLRRGALAEMNILRLLCLARPLTMHSHA